MRLPVYVKAREELVFTECSAAVFFAYIVARGLAYVTIVAVAMLLPRQPGIVLAGVSTAYLGAFLVDGALPTVFLWAGLIHPPKETTSPTTVVTPEPEPVYCWCAYCRATRVSETLLLLSAKSSCTSDDADELRAMSERIETIFPEGMHGTTCAQCSAVCDGDPRTHQGPCARDGLIFCSTLCSMAHKRGSDE